MDENPVQIRRNLRQLRTTLTMSWAMVRSSHAGGLLLKSNCCFRSGPTWHYSSETVHLCFVLYPLSATILHFFLRSYHKCRYLQECASINFQAGLHATIGVYIHCSNIAHEEIIGFMMIHVLSHIAGTSEIECVICGARL